MLLLQSGIGINQGEIMPSPVGWHVFFGLIALVVWPIIGRFGKGARALPAEDKRSANKIAWIITAITVAGYLVTELYAATTQHILGYTERESWGWLDSIYYYKPVYSGEWEGMLFMYLFPLLAAGAVYAAIRKFADKETFLSVFAARYPLMIMLCYVSYGLSVLVIQPEPKEEFSPEIETLPN
jgi:hypothetical protein